MVEDPELLIMSVNLLQMKIVSITTQLIIESACFFSLFFGLEDYLDNCAYERMKNQRWSFQWK